MTDVLARNYAHKFICIKCDFKCCKKNDFKRHVETKKHQILTNTDEILTTGDSFTQKEYKCDCGNLYKHRQSLFNHKKLCKHIETNHKETILTNQSNTITPELIMELIKDNQELKHIICQQNNTIHKQNDTINNLIINGTNNISNSLNNSNNKTFNLQFFLNETCKDAMNIMDFVDSIKLQLSDLEKVGEIGYTQGISDIITTHLKALDVTQRPLHCTDKKRETMYIKDEDKWEKEDENKNKIRKVIKKVANKNSRLLSQFREKNPNYKNAESHVSDKYDKMVVEAMGGHGDNDSEKENKIIHNISKCVTIDKMQ
jgi:hypothetical protein